MSIYVGDVGVIFDSILKDYEEVDGVATEVGVLNIAPATEITYYFKKPDGTTITKTLTGGKITKPGGGTDGKARYTSEAGFLDADGIWKRQVKVQFSATEIHSSEIVTFKVEPSL